MSPLDKSCALTVFTSFPSPSVLPSLFLSPFRERGPISGPNDRALPVARSAAQTHRHRRVQEQRVSDVATQRPRGRSRRHLLHHRGLQVIFGEPDWH